MRFLALAALVLGASTAATALRSPPSSHIRREEDKFHPAAVKAEGLAALAVSKGPTSGVAIPTTLAFQSVVNPLLAAIDQTSMKNFLVAMTQFPKWYYQSDNGVKAANWIVSKVQALTDPAGTKLTVSLFKHTWKQPSVIARYEPSTPSGLDGIVITGTHFDTLCSGSGRPEPNANPAADDCASGSAVIYETLRTLTLKGFVPKRPTEFHWYAAEEGIKVVSYLNLDQSGYVKPGSTEVIGVMTDYTTKASPAFPFPLRASTTFMTNIVKPYTTLQTVNT
ncbi:hypothetical protein HDU96_003120, partial [Phlyctochytrium bullatum]